MNQVADTCRQKGNRGIMAVKATRSDVARLAGVSPTTVSDVLNGNEKARVNEETRGRVVAAANELGYRANAMARGLVMQRSFNLGVVICNSRENSPMSRQSFMFDIMLGIQDAISEHRQNMVIVLADAITEVDYLGMLHERRVDGIIFCQMKMYDMSVLESVSGIENYPVITVSSRSEMPRYPYVCVDNRGGIFQAVAHLVQLGHKRIGYVNAAADSSDFIERIRAYEEALIHYGLEFDPGIVLSQRPYSHNEMGNALIYRDDRPTAIIAAQDGLAVWLCHAIRRCGLSVPDDIAVIGFDDAAEAGHCDPPLTTIRQPTYRMGIAAANKLLGLVMDEGGGGTAAEVMPTELIIRESCGAARSVQRWLD